MYLRQVSDTGAVWFNNQRLVTELSASTKRILLISA